MYEVTFTKSFKDGLERLPKEIHPIIDRQLRLIETDPFAKNPNATRMKNAYCTFRTRIGIHVRMLYRVHSQEKRVVVQAIGTREHIYEQNISDLPPLKAQEVADILEEIRGIQKIRIVKPTDLQSGRVLQPEHAQLIELPDLPIVTELLPWITEDELFLLHIPQELWSGITDAKSVKGLEALALSDSVKFKIEDYWTAPSPTQVEKLYSLSPGQGSDTIAQQPLTHFLIALDPEQKNALRKIKGAGPYLLKGSAGTGKSLVGLYHIRDLMQSRSGQTLFDGAAGRYGVITYTNTLVDASRTLLASISPNKVNAEIYCSTLEKLAYDLTEKALGIRPMALNTVGISKRLVEYVIPGLSQNERDIVAKLGCDYIADEIEQVIYGNGLTTLPDYIDVVRTGRKRGLRDGERAVVWQVFTGFQDVCRKRNEQTFEQWRVIALDYLRSDSTYPRFTALFVDEAQDFSKVARQLCVELVRDPRHLLLAADSGQSIYSTPPSWAQSDPRLTLTGKSIALKRSYRATLEIGRAITPLRVELSDGEEPSGPAGPVFSGPKPQWIDQPLVMHANIVCELVAQYTKAERNPVHPSQIAIIVRENGHAQKYETALRRAGIKAVLITKGSPLKINGQYVHIVTAHSAKGLGFPVVIVPEVGASSYPWKFLTDKANKDPGQIEQIADNEQRLLYVAMSRASHRLHMLTDSLNPSPFIEKLDRSAHWD